MELMFFLSGAAVTASFVWFASRRFDFLAQTPDDYSDGPEFDVREVLKGPLLCDGIIYGPTGRVSSRFHATFDAEWNGDNGVMKERFHYDSGTVQDREWRLSVSPDGTIEADADDLAKPGYGRQSGSGVKLAYSIRLPESAGGHVLDVVDWMYLLDNGTVMNRSQFRKFGIKVGELVANIRPDPAAAKNQNKEAA